MRRLLVLPLAVLLLGLGTPDAHAATAASLRSQVEAALAGSSARSVAVAVDVDGLGAVDRRGSTVALPPASTEKLLTAEAALRLLGPTYRQRTDLRSVGVRGTALLRGDLYLVAGGDPYLTATQLDALARSFAATGIRTISGHLVVDDTRYDRVRRGSGWKREWVPEESGPLSAMALDGNGWRRDASYLADPATPVLVKLRTYLARKGVRFTTSDYRIGQALPARHDLRVARLRPAGHHPDQAPQGLGQLRRRARAEGAGQGRARPGDGLRGSGRGARADRRERHGRRRLRAVPVRPADHRPPAGLLKGSFTRPQDQAPDRLPRRHAGAPLLRDRRLGAGIREDRHARHRAGPRGLDLHPGRPPRDVLVPAQRLQQRQCRDQGHRPGRRRPRRGDRLLASVPMDTGASRLAARRRGRRPRRHRRDVRRAARRPGRRPGVRGVTATSTAEHVERGTGLRAESSAELAVLLVAAAGRLPGAAGLHAAPTRSPAGGRARAPWPSPDPRRPGGAGRGRRRPAPGRGGAAVRTSWPTWPAAGSPSSARAWPPASGRPPSGRRPRCPPGWSLR